VLSSTERAHIPQWRGGAAQGLSSKGRERGRRRGGGGGGGLEGRNKQETNEHQPLMRLMFDSNSACTHNDRARSYQKTAQLEK